MLVGCGGGSGSGNGGSTITIPKMIEAPATLTEDNARDAASLGFMLDETVGEFLGFSEIDLARSVVSSPGLTRRTGEGHRVEKRSKLERLSGLPIWFLSERAAGGSAYSRSVHKDDCEYGGSISFSENEIRFNNCAEGYDYGDGEYWKEWTNGVVSFQETKKAGYDEAFEVTMNLAIRYEETWDDEKESGEFVQKGSMLYASSISPEKYLLEINQLDMAGKGSDACGSWDGHVWIRDYRVTSDSDGSGEVVEYTGKVGDSLSLNGTLEVKTDSVLKYIDDSYAPFPHGDSVVITGAANGELRVIFTSDGEQADVKLNDRLIETFTDWDDFEDWAEDSESDC